MRSVAGLVLVAAVAGCEPGAERPPPDPLPTDGPNQVVFHVPGMTCESCPERVAKAVAALPGVDPGTIHADRTARQVRFTLTDRPGFDPAAVTDAIARTGYKKARLLVGPTDPPKGASP